MHWLAAALGALVTKLLDFFGTVIGRKIVIGGIAVAAVAAAAVALVAGLESLMATLVQTQPGGWVANGVAMLPANAADCFAAVASAYGLAWIYRAKIKAVQLRLKF